MTKLRNQSIQAFVTGLGPFCDGSYKFLHCPKNIKSSNSCLVSAFQNNLRALLVTFSNRFHCLFFEVVVIDAWNRYHVKLLYRLVGCLKISPHISLQDLPYRRTIKKYETLQKMVIFLLLPQKFVQTWFCHCPQYLCSFDIIVECTPNTHDPGKMLVLPNQLLH